MSEEEPRHNDELVVDQEWDEEEGGGPVKTFLEHLEDLRWTLIKCIVAIVVSMMVCFSMLDNIIAILTAPLEQAEVQKLNTNNQVGLTLGDTRIASISILSLTNSLEIENIEEIHSLKLIPVKVGDQTLLSIEPSKDNPINMMMSRLKNYRPVDGFLVAFQLTLYGGFVIAAPLVMFFLGQFILPALRIHEKKFLYQTTGFGAGLFILGILFCYFVMMKIAILALVQFSNWLGFAADEWNAKDYTTFVIKFMLAMGLSFQLPVVILTMVKIGFLDYKKLNTFRPYWVIANLTICAFLTPTGDPFTLLLMALPLHLLYELSVLISRFWARKDEEKRVEEA